MMAHLCGGTLLPPQKDRIPSAEGMLFAYSETTTENQSFSNSLFRSLSCREKEDYFPPKFVIFCKISITFVSILCGKDFRKTTQGRGIEK
jgi:hypothetical protein